MPCQNCGKDAPVTKAFCCPACREAFHNRMSKRGRVAIPLAMVWRAGRGSRGNAKAALAELCAYLDACNAEDRAAGRPPMGEYVGRRMAGEWSGGHGWRERKAMRSASPTADAASG